MFEITGDDIKALDDKQLRTLIARLAIAELKKSEEPISGVTAGGHQNAPDGGIDVWAETKQNDFAGDFLKRVPLGFQAKASNMPRSAILEEMAPGGELRPVIVELADANGAYVIVSSHGTVANAGLKNRRQAMQDALGDLPTKDQLLIDFYDRERMATWVEQYPGVASWVREKAGRRMAGWEPIGRWLEAGVSGPNQFLIDDEATLIDARAKSQAPHSILDGIAIIRDELRKPGSSSRLIGVSGVGKTRFIQALFEDEVGEEALDPALTLYTDYNETPTPSAKHMAQSLVEADERAILVVDNCEPQLHSDLAAICTKTGSRVSLLTVEYDVRGDEPERTEVFRLSASSEKTIAEWLKLNFDHISQVDRDRIAEFCGGNFRVARVLAETVERGDTLGQLTDSQLFERIFRQRNDPDHALLRSAEILALLYSYNGEETGADSELAILATLSNTDAETLFEASVQFEQREVAQRRGVWRAVLPQAIANRLAKSAIERLSNARLDQFIANLNPRMATSFTRRIGYLHDNDRARELTARLLQSDGPLGDLLSFSDHSLQLLHNLAPVAPDLVLGRIAEVVDGPSGDAIINPAFGERWQLTNLLRSIAYDPELFDQAARLLARFVMAEAPDENRNSARSSFEALFHLHLSGTHAGPDQRRALAHELCQSADTKQVGLLALRALLHGGHFSSVANFDFGARSRDFGWRPETYGDQWNWYADAVRLAHDLCSDETLRSEIALEIANGAEHLLTNEPSREQFDAFTSTMLEDGPWIDGWRNIRRVQGYWMEDWPPELQEYVSELERKLRPTDRASEIQAWVLSGHSATDLVEPASDGESPSDRYHRAQDKARELGVASADDGEALYALFPGLMSIEHGYEVALFGRGLAEASSNREQLWQTMVSEFGQVDPNKRNATLLAGFVTEAKKHDRALVERILDEALTNELLQPHLFLFQIQTGFDNAGLERIWTAIDQGTLDPWRFGSLASGAVREFPEAELPKLLKQIASLEGGQEVAIKIFHMAVYCAETDDETVSEALLQAGRDILTLCDFSDREVMTDHAIRETVEYCYAKGQADDQLRTLAELIKRQFSSEPYRAWQYENAVSAIFKTNPAIALDVFVLADEADQSRTFDYNSWVRGSPIETVPSEKLWNWADNDAETRYTLLGRILQPFPEKIGQDNSTLSKTFVEALDRAPDRTQFLTADAYRIGPRGWSGSLAAILDQRYAELQKLADHEDEAVREWVQERSANLVEWANHERERESEREERFE